MAENPLAEVFGFPPDNLSQRAERVRRNKLCPFNNKEPNCNKDKKNDPLGTCSIVDGGTPTITCPIRFTEDWLIAEDAAEFFGFSDGTWQTLREVRLNDRNGRSAGNIDFVLVSYDDQGLVRDFGSLEVQSVYITGNVRQPFSYYMQDRENRKDMIWNATTVRADYLSSSCKRLMPQLTFKGGILKEWDKKQAVALDRKFFDTLPMPPTVSKREAELAWLIYDLEKDTTSNVYRLVKLDTIYTKFEPALSRITSPEAGEVGNFTQVLQKRLDVGLETPPNNEDPTVDFRRDL